MKSEMKSAALHSFNLASSNLSATVDIGAKTSLVKPPDMSSNRGEPILEPMLETEESQAELFVCAPVEDELPSWMYSSEGVDMNVQNNLLIPEFIPPERDDSLFANDEKFDLALVKVSRY